MLAGMTTLGSMFKGGKVPSQLDVASLVASIDLAPLTVKLGSQAVLASCLAWTDQDDDAHEMCSLTACRAPLHPGPCKGWKGTLHMVSPGTYHQIEAARVQKANARRIKRIADLRSQGKPIPRKLLTEIKAKPAPAHSMTAMPLGQVNQKADLAGGQAHHAGQAVSNAAGVKVKTAPLPLGPKQKKPSVAGRGPAFVITQPKVTDTYKLDKAAKITPQEWDDLTSADKATIRNELTAIKARGFGPQQTKADALLAKLPAANTVGNTAANPAPGRVSLGQATKTIPSTPSSAPSATPQLPPPAPSPKRGTRDQNGILNTPKIGGGVSSTSVGLPSGYRITRDGMGYSLKHNGKLIRTSNSQANLEQYAKDHAKVQLGHTPGNAPAAPGVSGTPPTPAQAAPASSPGIKPSAPLAPGTAAHVQHANAVANRTAPKASMGKTHVDAYGKLSKGDFDALPADTQKTIRDDLANARAKFLDPKKQQAAKDLLDRFGSRHPAPASPAAPATTNAPAPTGPKGYSDPMNEAVKAAKHEVDRDIVLKRIGQLSHSSISGLDDADRTAIVNRLSATAGSRTLPQATKDRAAALKRMIEAGPQPGGTRRDHEPSLNELYADTQTPAALTAVKVAAALNAADAKTGLTPGTQRADRIKALSALSKAQFDALKPDEQRKITDALGVLHTDRQNGGIAQIDPDVEKALVTYTGQHPAIHRLQQAEADFRRGRIDADKLWSEFLHARVQAPSKYNDPASPGAILAKEAQRVAEDNPKLPLWLRASMIENPYGGDTYDSIARASNKYDYVPAPRLSSSDISAIFGATGADLASSHPIHAEAVKALRENLVTTGLSPGTPWSTATKNHVVDNLLHISYSDHEIPADRLKDFKGYPDVAQVQVARVLRQRLTDQTDDHTKTGTYLALHQIDGSPAFTPEQHAAALAAASRFATPDLDTYRKLDPREFDDLPVYVRNAIGGHLDEAQKRVERLSGGNNIWMPSDNPLKVMPAALKDHLDGMRTAYPDRNVRAASDVANFGQKIYVPYSRVNVYGDVPIGKFHTMSQGDQDLIHADLERIAADTNIPLATRYKARLTRDLYLDTPTFTSRQLAAIGVVDPAPSRASSDQSVVNALTDLDKADYDSLGPVYREAIDQRILGLTLGPQQQALGVKFHPAAPQAATPAGVTPTTAQANVPPHIQAALDTIYGVHASGKSHTMAHQLSTYGALRGNDFAQLNSQEQGHLLGDLSFIATTAKGPSADKARKLIDRFTPAGTPSGQVPTGAVIPPANALPGQVRYATPLKGLEQAKDSGVSGDGWISLPGGGRVWGAHGAAGLLLMHKDPQTGEKRYLMVQRGPAISDPGKWTFPGGASDSKETPHEGAARETIEELGLKADSLKDALVHGDHTFSVPNHTWKYTTVAAEVPTMIKPNLTTAHARAETSDAKWMTIDEIRALDKNGELHGPIAGGKLEQNVISLYPQGTGTLGQIVRPGPVTKRLGRLRVPQGGRQAPNTPPNAWTKPHKPSKGKDLIPDKAAFDAMRQKIKNDRKAYDGKTADGRLAAIGALQGFDDTPTVVDKAEIDRLLATGDYIEAWRGVTGAGGYGMRSRGGSGGKTAKQINEEMRSGPAYYGKGIFGNGYYLATQRRVASQYADSTSGSVVRVLIPKSAITQKYDKVSRESHANPRTSKAKGGGYDTSTFYDPGRYAAAKGLDGIEIEHHHISPGGGARHVAASGKPAFNWLNRSVLIVQKEAG